MNFLNALCTDEALDALAEAGEGLLVLAGGTDVMVQHQRQAVQPAGWLCVRVIAELKRIEPSADALGRLVIGAMASHREVWRNETVARSHPGLAVAAASVGGWQTQEAGTLGGNICNASPAADTVPPLLVADAIVTLRSTRGDRELRLPDFLLGRKTIDRRPDELLTSVSVEPLPASSAEVYLKVGPRQAMEVALAGLAVRLTIDDSGVVTQVRIAAGSVSAVAFRATEAEQVIIGSRLDSRTIADAGLALESAAAPIDDHRASANYRRRILAPLLERALDRCVAQIGGAN